MRSLVSLTRTRSQKRQDLDHHARLVRQIRQLVKLARMIVGLPTTWRQHALVQNVPQHGRVLASQDQLPIQPPHPELAAL